METNPITIKPKTASHVEELFSWGPLPYYSPPGCPFPIKYLALSARMSPWTIHFRVLDESPVSSPGRSPPSCNKWRVWRGLFFTATDTLTTWGYSGASLPANSGDTGSTPGSGRYPGGGNGNHSSILTWEIPWMEGPGGLQSMGW